MFNFLLEAAQQQAGGFGFTTIFMLILLIGMFWFMSRSNKKKEKEAAEMRDSLQVGDEVTTIGGIIGKVVSIKEETFVLETTKEKTHIRFLKGAIRSVDVKIADLNAAANIETKTDAAPVAQEKPAKKGLFGKKKAKAEEKAEEKTESAEENK